MNEWLLLVLSLPTQNASLRMRIWRALKSLGCAVLRDGVYLLPDGESRRALLEEQAREVEQAGGVAYVLSIAAAGDTQQAYFITLFDRSDAYVKLLADIEMATRNLAKEKDVPLQRLARGLRRQFDGITAVDYFPDAASFHAAHVLAEFESAIQARLCADEPHSIPGAIERLDRQFYRRRLWATRVRPWVDRLASAWLIRRFIDPEARLIWIDTAENCPSEALGFDFDGAAFTHVGQKVTFEVLLGSFGLEHDAGLLSIARIVHYLDVGGIPIAEGAGVELLLRGMQQRITDDDELLAEAERAFDSLYHAFSGSEA